MKLLRTSRRNLVSLVLTLVVAALSLTSTSSGRCDDKPQVPNIVLILADDIGWTDYGFMGHRHIETPRIDQLARESLLFTRGYVPTSLCRPSLMTLLTGLYPHQHGITGNDPAGKGNRAALLTQVDRFDTLPRMLQRQGYLSLQTGKWWEGDYQRAGFTHGMSHGDTQRGGRHGDEGLQIGRQGLKPIEQFLDDAGEKPFFLWYAPMLPHEPHNPPARLLAKYQARTPSIHVARYWAMVEWFDETCGDLLKLLDARGLRDNTLVIYIADNGWIQNEDKRSFDPRSKRSPYDGGLRTPIMLRWPNKVPPRRDDEHVVSSLDFLPTCLKVAGITPPASLTGRDLLDASLDAQRTAAYGAVFDHDIRDLANPAASLLQRWCVDERYKLIVAHTKQATELYDVVDDPHERKNLSDERPQVVETLRKQLDAWWQP